MAEEINTRFKYAAASASVSDEVSQWFQAVDRDRSGQISWEGKFTIHCPNFSYHLCP